MKIFRLKEFYFALICIACVVFFQTIKAELKNVAIVIDGAEQFVEFPYKEIFQKGERFRFTFDVRHPLNLDYELHIVPDDCAEWIAVNGERFSLHDTPGHCDYAGGFVFSLDSILKEIPADSTHLELEVRNNGGLGGLNISAKTTNFWVEASRFLALFTFALLLFCLLRRLKIGFVCSLLLCLGVVLRIYFASQTPYSRFAYDVDAHVDYIRYVAENFSVPDNEECWACYHPPVYYLLMAPVWKMAECLRFSPPRMIQFADLFLSAFTLLFGFLALKRLLSGKALALGTLLWVFWPGLVLCAPRIGNDQLFFLWHAICLWGSLCYVTGKEDGRAKFIGFAAVAAFLAFWTKTTGIVSVGTVVLSFVLGYANRRRLRPKFGEWSALAAIFIWALTVIVFKVFGNASLVDNAHSLNSALRVGNLPGNYLFFDLRDFLMNAFVSAWNDAGGRQYFWNYAIKTSLFGEFSWTNLAFGQGLAVIVSVSALGILLYSIRGIWKTKWNLPLFIMLVSGLAFTAALLFLRIKIPFSCSNDFRYIMPVLLSVISFFVVGVSLPDTSRRWKILGVLLAIVFAVSSVALFLVI
ncbi:hypothetical protein [Fibrobacter intestinalis]|uniref:Dolichyl-phosphate-mannose-protein mannosyltransferase n=1 Tax=Fibrobacter intestinalis TaxID=28122 RepID=A0A1T4LPQ4_9BACT|nr:MULTISPECIES: hypothetical protein [Fibrobacter]PBC73886.1 hypothetical protein BGW94_1511 [Fibrobacter sp. NR9]SJZ56444.1 hypothetical protein SAMN02745108_00969 [Fibrobacter intestinalis]